MNMKDKLVVGAILLLWVAMAFVIIEEVFFNDASASTTGRADQEASVSQEQIDQETLHRLVFAVQIHVDGLADRVLYITEDYSVMAYEQQQLNWAAKQALWRLRKAEAVGDLYIQTPCGAAK